MAGHTKKKKQMKVCDICGDRGFSNALLYCSACPDTVVHQYCLGIPPGSIDDTFSWVCEYCCEPMESQPWTSMDPGDASTNRGEETCEERVGDLKEVEFKMVDISSLYPKNFTRKGKRKKQNRRRVSFSLNSDKLCALLSECKRNKMERSEDQYLSETVDAETVKKRQCGLITGVTACSESMAKLGEETKRQLESVTVRELNAVEVAGNATSTMDDPKMDHCQADEDAAPSDQDKMAMVLLEEQPEPLITLLPLEYQGSSEQALINHGFLRATSSGTGQLLDSKKEPEAPASSLMECPVEISRDLILLVSLSGEIHIRQMSFPDYSHSPNLATSVHKPTSSSNDISSDSLVKDAGVYSINPDLNPLGDIIDRNGPFAQKCSIPETAVLDEHSLGSVDKIERCHSDEVASITKVGKRIVFFDGAVDAC